MAERSRLLLGLGLVALGSLGLLAGCAHGSKATPVPVPQVAPPEPPPSPPEPAPREPTLVVIDPGTNEKEPPSLAEAARRERERRSATGEPVAVITDETLPEYAKGGQLTFMRPPADKGEEAGAAAGETNESQDSESSLRETEKTEEYWRSRALQIRLRWRQAVEERQELEETAAELRRRFYSEDDPYVRDTQIKPAWDRILDRLAQVKEDARSYRLELEALMEEGRRAGALPGWLREGIEHEPDDPAEEEIPSAEPSEPKVIDEP